jgi:hypothetical protein
VAILEDVARRRPGPGRPIDASGLSTALLLRLEEVRGDLSLLTDAELDELDVAARRQAGILDEPQ